MNTIEETAVIDILLEIQKDIAEIKTALIKAGLITDIETR